MRTASAATAAARVLVLDTLLLRNMRL
jgi:hypothetical protein